MISGATLGVFTALLVADLTNRTGRFNLAQGVLGTASWIGVALSTALSGLITEGLGYSTGLVVVMAVALLAVAVLWLFLPETRVVVHGEVQQHSGAKPA